MNKRGLRKCDADSLEEFLAVISCAFGGVKTLTLIATHVASGDEWEHPDSQLSLRDPIDTDYLEVHHDYSYSDEEGGEEMEIIHRIAKLNINWLKVNLEKLQRMSGEVTDARPTPWVVPKIECKIVIPDVYQPFLDWIEEKYVESLEWEKEQ